VAGQPLIVFLRTQKVEVPALETLSQVRQSDELEDLSLVASSESPFRTEAKAVDACHEYALANLIT
jgi:hypothetical protein